MTGDLPHDIAAEQIVLGAMMLSPAVVPEITGIVAEADYFRPAHQAIHAAISALASRGDPHDAVAVKDELGRRGELRGQLDAPYLHTLLESVPSSAMAGFYARIVASRSRSRKMLEIAAKLRQVATSADDLDLGEHLTAIAHDLAVLSAGQRDDRTDTALADRYTPVDWVTAFASQPASTEWLLEPLLERGTINALFARPGTGKSLLALEIAVNLAKAGITVVYIDDENRVADVVERLQAFGCTPEQLGLLRFYSFAGLPALDTDPGGRHLLAIAGQAGAVLVILDTTTRMVAGKENDSDTFLQLYRCSLVPLKARGITVLRLDHPGKDIARGQRGSSAKDGDVDTIWRLDKLTATRLRLEREKSRSGHGQGVVDVWRRSEPLRHEWDLDAETPVEIIAGKLDGLKVPAGAGRPAIREALRTIGLKVSNALLADVIKYRKAEADRPSGQTGQLPLPDDAGQPGDSLEPGDDTAGQEPENCPGQFPDSADAAQVTDCPSVPHIGDGQADSAGAGDQESDQEPPAGDLEPEPRGESEISAESMRHHKVHRALADGSWGPWEDYYDLRGTPTGEKAQVWKFDRLVQLHPRARRRTRQHVEILYCAEGWHSRSGGPDSPSGPEICNTLLDPKWRVAPEAGLDRDRFRAFHEEHPVVWIVNIRMNSTALRHAYCDPELPAEFRPAGHPDTSDSTRKDPE
jgi:hypothetical protein